jgi:hypothetical protein
MLSIPIADLLLSSDEATVTTVTRRHIDDSPRCLAGISLMTADREGVTMGRRVETACGVGGGR